MPTQRRRRHHGTGSDAQLDGIVHHCVEIDRCSGTNAQAYGRIGDWISDMRLPYQNCIKYLSEAGEQSPDEEYVHPEIIPEPQHGLDSLQATFTHPMATDGAWVGCLVCVE